jgi:hypothetical protein
MPEQTIYDTIALKAQVFSIPIDLKIEYETWDQYIAAGLGVPRKVLEEYSTDTILSFKVEAIPTLNFFDCVRNDII